jgi:hypothetical protein
MAHARGSSASARGPALTEDGEMQTSVPSRRCTPFREAAPISRRDLSKNETRCSCVWDTYRFAAVRNMTYGRSRYGAHGSTEARAGRDSQCIGFSD